MCTIPLEAGSPEAKYCTSRSAAYPVPENYQRKRGNNNVNYSAVHVDMVLVSSWGDMM